MNKSFLLLLALILGFSGLSLAQKAEVVQLSGIIVTGDSLMPVPFTSVYTSARPFTGTSSDYYGFFSIPAEVGDTVNFTCVGYRASEYVVPKDSESSRFSVVQFMRRDTINLPTTFIYPWPSRERFKEDFLALDLPDDDIARMRKNLDPEVMYDRMMEMGMSGQESFTFAMQQQHANSMRYAATAPSIQLLNPIAWAQFIQAWKRGDFKSKR